jgi:ABC-2 type transport system ATP-binding protein
VTSNPILKIQTLHKSFGQKKVLKGIDLDIFEGEIIGLVGASGGGKTTLLKNLIGFLTPERGDIKFSHSSFVGSQSSKYESIYKHHSLTKNIFGFASQNPSFYAKLTVKENLEYFGNLYNLSKKSLETNINILLTLMDLKNAHNTLAQDLSGGMARRLDIACALIHDPEVLILDEPTADLDPFLRDHIWNLVQKVNRKGTTIIVASHHLSEIEEFCSRIAVLKNGSMIDIDTPSRLKRKYTDFQEIRLQSYPGDYKKISSAIEGIGKITSVSVKGSELVLMTSKVGSSLDDLLKILRSLKEEVIDIRVLRPDLDEVFLKITAKKD